jgi:hypothetical protein
LVVGNLTVEDLDGIFQRARVAVEPLAGPRRLELAYFRPADWTARIATGDSFAAALWASERIKIVASQSQPVIPFPGAGLAERLAD